MPLPLAARSKALVCGRSPAEIVGSDPTGSVDVCCQVEVSATSWSLVQRSPTDCGASLSVIQKPREWGGSGQLGGCHAKNKNTYSSWNQTSPIPTTTAWSHDGTPYNRTVFPNCFYGDDTLLTKKQKFWYSFYILASVDWGMITDYREFSKAFWLILYFIIHINTTYIW